MTPAISMRDGDGINPAKAKADARTARAFREKAIQLAAWADRRVVNRRTAHGHYIAPSSRRDPDLTAYTDKTPLTIGTLVEHFKAVAQGDIRGLHATARDEATGPGEVNACWSLWGAIDIDRHAEGTDPEATLKAALAWYDRLVGLGFHPLLEDSDGRGGYHLWVLFDGPAPTAHVFRLLRWLVGDWKALGLDKQPESFPKQPAIEAGGYGNWLRLFGRHHTRDHWSRFWSGDRWLDGQDAVDLITSIVGDSASLIPAGALTEPKHTGGGRSIRKFTGEGDEGIAAEALGYLDPSPYEDWIRYGMALHSRFGPGGLPLWDHWSRGADNYDPGACERKWETFNPNGAVKLGTLLGEAKQRGWPGQRQATERKSTTALGVFRGGEPTDELPRKLPVIHVTTREHDVNNLVEAALEPDPDLFQRNNAIVSVQRSSAAKRGKKKATLNIPVGTPRIVAVPASRLREIITRNAVLEKWSKTEEQWVAAHVPDWMTPAIIARGDWPSLRHIEGVVESPTLRLDGSVLDVPGWDEESGLFYCPNSTFLAVPEFPTHFDAQTAAKFLLDLVGDFPFLDERHKCVWLAGLLTLIARHAIAGPVPLFVFDANTPGTGKGKLCDLIAIIFAGREMAKADYPDEETEVAKQFFALSEAVIAAALFDNVPAGVSIGGKTIERVSTAGVIGGRTLGKTEWVEREWKTVLFFNGNNINARGDSLRRALYSRMESDQENPEERDSFKIPGDIIDHAREDRPQLVRAALTILRAFVVAGRPEPSTKLPSIDYRAWCGLIRNSIHWATGLDPCATRAELKKSDPDASARKALIEGWDELTNAHRGLSVGQALKEIKDNPSKFDGLRNALMAWSRNDELPSTQIVGKRLLVIKGRNIGGKMFLSVPYQGSQRWSVVEATSGGSGESGGSVSTFAGGNQNGCSGPNGEENTPMEPEHSHDSNHSHGATDREVTLL